MGKLPGINHERAIRAFQRAGFEVVRQGGHVSMSNGRYLIVIPRNNPINAITMFRIVRDAGMTTEEFRRFL